MNRKTLTTAHPRAVIARAHHCGADPEILTRFAHTLVTLDVQKGDRAAQTILALRNALDSSVLKGHWVSQQTYRKVQRMLHAYLNGEILTKCYASDEDFSPL